MTEETKQQLKDVVSKYRENTASYNALMVELEIVNAKVKSLNDKRTLLYDELLRIRTEERDIMAAAEHEPGYDEEQFKTEIDEFIKTI